MTGEIYDLKSVKLPYFAGSSLRLFINLLEGPLGGFLIPSLLQSAGINDFRKQQFDEPPTFAPLYPPGNEPETQAAELPDTLQSPQAGHSFEFASVHDYARSYREGQITPEQVAQAVIQAVDASNAATPPLRAIIAMQHEDVLRQAEASGERLRRGEPLSILEGVPVGVKDEIDMLPYPTTVGTAFMGKKPAEQDATTVGRLRAAGALLIGKANMHEIGIGVTGLNTVLGTPRNPYHPDHYTGGSSSGVAAAVAAGFCPLGLGADGGGSIRIPSSFCGVVGLKPTYGRVSEIGAAPLCWSVAHVGPIAASAADAALGYMVIAGHDSLDCNTHGQPTPTLAGWENSDLHDLTLGVFWPWFRHASPEVVSACEALLAKFEGMGAKVEEVSLDKLDAARVAHLITISSEMAQSLDYDYAQHHREHNADVRINLVLARTFTSRDYIHAQRVRTHLMHEFERVFTQVHALVTPATGVTAPPISAAALSDGESDLTTLTEIMRYATPANLTGLPAISFPAGYSQSGLPIGMQVIGRPWQEASLLRLARAAEQSVQRKAPKIHYSLLG